MPKFLAFQNTYEELQIALMQDIHLIDKRTFAKIKASALFIPQLQDLLSAHNLILKDIPFMAVNQGPGPFTTLRVVISSVNGLSFASKIPLIGIDGLNAFMQEYKNSHYLNTIVLLNAFNQEVYFARQKDGLVLTGYENIDRLLTQLKNEIPDQTVRFLGNGTQLYQEKIESVFNKNAHIPKQLPLYCSIEQIGKMGFDTWQKNKTGTNQLMPLYLKKPL